MEPVALTMAQLDQPITRKCPRATGAIGSYMQLLHGENLCPWSSQFETTPFRYSIQRAIAAARIDGGNPLLLFEPCTRSYDCICSDMRYENIIHLAKRLGKAVEKAKDWNLWLCLDCLKSGGTTAERRSCRVPHWQNSVHGARSWK